MHKFIAFEGIDGSGKNTCIERVYEALRYEHDLFLSKEPTNSKYGNLIRGLYSLSEIDINKYKEKLLFLHTRDRRSHQKYLGEVLEHDHVLCNRYILSTIAYQGAQGIGEERIIRANSSFIQPDLTILLDVPVEVAMQRMDSEKKIKEVFEKDKFLKKVRNIYMKHASLDKRIICIDATPPIEEVTDRLLIILRQELTAN